MTRERLVSLRRLSWVLAPVITIAAFAYLLAQIEPAAIWRALVAANRQALAAFFVILCAGVLARASRFWILLDRSVRFPLLVGIVLVRNLFVDLLPARLGELAYVYLLKQRAERAAGEGVATVVIAAVLDVLVLAPMLLGAVLMLGAGGEVSATTLAGVSVGLGLLVIVAAIAAEPVVSWLDARWRGARPESLAGRVHTRIADDLQALVASLRKAREGRVLWPALGLTLIVRACKFGAYYALIVAVLAPGGFRSTPRGVASAFLGVQSAELAAMLPVHGVAGFGSYEAVWAFSFEQLGFSRDQAILSALLGHALFQGVEYVMGGIALLVLYRRASRPLPRIAVQDERS
ncbi:MAG TPA: lysylphosphatidylglycerol synthase transmembrane domain-containing protein [Vicinamibacterales bacterium]